MAKTPRDVVKIQVAAGEPTVGRVAIRDGFATFFGAFPDNDTRLVNLFEDGEWAILECTGGGRIKFQRGYWDKASWFHQLGLPV